jgi:chromosome partitioning protein
MSTAPVIVGANEKGGVGKTLITANVAAGLARTGLRVVVIDGDSQANLTGEVGAQDVPVDGGLTDAIDAIAAGAPFDPALLLPTAVDGLMVLHGGQGLADIAGSLYAAEEEGEGWVCTAIRAVADLDEVDVVVVDTPPSPGPITIGALLAADVVLAIANCRLGASVEAVATVLDRAEALGPRRVGDGHGRVVLTGFQEQRVMHRDMKDYLERTHGDPLFAVIPHNKDAEESSLDGVPLLASRRRGSSRTAWALADLASASLALATAAAPGVEA